MTDFQAHYRDLSSDELEWIALNKAATLLPEALQALREEIDRRGIVRSIERGVEAQTRHWSKEELEALIERYRRGACPQCGSRAEMLNAATVAVAHSFLIFSMLQPKVIVGCSGCIRAEAKRLSAKSLLLGWWGIPWGPIFTIRALSANAKAKSVDVNGMPTLDLCNHVINNIGEIAADMTDR